MSDFGARRTMMVDTQVRPSDVTSFPIIDAMLSVPREVFVPDALAEVAYVGEDLDIGGRVMLAPRVFAKMLDALKLTPRDMVLDIGCGLGYSAAVMAHICEAVVAVEDDAERASEAQNLLSGAEADNAAVIEGPLAEGAAKHGPYDAIFVEGAVETVPQALTDQLKEGGRIVAIFQAGGLGVVRLGRRAGGRVAWRDIFNATAAILPGFQAARSFAL